MATLRIAGGRVIDPANGINDEIRDIWIEDGRVIAPPADPEAKADRTIDARGLRGHARRGRRAFAHRRLEGQRCACAAARGAARADAVWPRRDGFRSGTRGSVPSTFVTGYQYAGLGYTTAVDAAIPPLGARQAHAEFGDTPIVDKPMLVLMGNHHAIMDQVRAGDAERLRQTVAWLLDAAGGFGVKVVNPGGVEQWKQGKDEAGRLGRPRGPFRRHSPADRPAAWPARSTNSDCPIPIHLHGLNLGVPGQLGDDARGDEGGRGASAAPGAYPVPQLRRLGRPDGGLRFAGRAAGRLCEHARESAVRRRPGGLR